MSGEKYWRERHVRVAKKLTRALGRVPTIKEIANAVGRSSTNIIYYWGFRSREIGCGTGRKASQRLYDAAGLTKRGVGGSGHIDPGAAGRGRKDKNRHLTPQQVRQIWDCPHPYSVNNQPFINHGIVEAILKRRTYQDVTEGWPTPHYRRRR